MEAGGDDPSEPLSPAVSSLKNIEQGKLDNPPCAEMLESGLPDKTEAAKPLHSAEVMVEIPAATDCPSKNSRAPRTPLQTSHGGKPKLSALSVHDVGATNNSPLRQPLWGEEMSGVPSSQSSPLSRNRVSKASCNLEEHSWSFGSNLSTERQRFPFSFCWSKLKTEAPTVRNVNRPSQQGSEDLEIMVTEHSAHSSDEEEGEMLYDSKQPRWGNGKLESNGSEVMSAEPAEDEDPVVLAMFHAVANSRMAVRSQQKDEPDFTPAQKLAILKDLYHTKPLVFLERFRTVLREEHLPCFHHLSGSYEADFYCAEVRRAGLGKTRHTRVRNKRYAALQQLIRGGEYFSDEQMRCRDPLHYEQYIGQYLSDEELQALGNEKLEASCSLSGVLLDSYQEQVIQRRLQVQQEQEEACEEEEEEDDNDNDKASDPDMDEWVPDPEEKAILREEFTSRMYQRFLDGKDRDFNYSEVDENPDFDNLDIVSRDEEERYFDGEDPEDADTMEAE